jgi:hypothetical protein
VSKQALGRGLDRLMQKPPADPAQPGSAELTPGLKVLVRGSVEEPAAAPQPAPTAPPTADPATVAAETASAPAAENAARPEPPEEKSPFSKPSRFSEPSPFAAPGEPPAPPDRKRLYVAAFVAADIALGLWPLLYLWQHTGRVPGLMLAACAVSLVVGAVAGLMALMAWTE